MIGGSSGAPRNAKRRLKRLKSSDEEDPTETEEEGEPSPKKRRLVRGLKPSRSEDELDLLDEVDEHRVIDSRLRTRDKKTAFQRSLETLKRQRSGLSIDSPKSSEEEDEEDPIQEPSRAKWDFFRPFGGARPSKDVKSDEEVEEEDDNEGNNEEEDGEEGEDSWIVEDDDPEGVPELPVAFNMSSHQDLSHHFKIVCQLFVHLVVRTPSQRASFIQDIKADDYFYAALSTVRRKLMGMRDSLITSSTWQTKYKGVLEKYPVLSLMGMDFAVPGCDACNLGARMSKVIGRVSGQPYDRSTFESGGESEDERPKKQMHLGRFCAKRTQSFHEFTHWEWKLFDLLSTEVRELRSTGNKGFVKVAYAKGIRPPEDIDDADGITDWLDQRGIITMAWTEMKQMMERARKLESIGKKED
ncbi:hypothetical protein BJ322DRAFT_997286 [Thelephora terrestris]|uniref:DUF4211 domain-containing protein n=1 Tax=Thelephora terrestris TaxID=56493 RepID=A0A9P6HQ93_9AGAM|nr:hypothetical protein BJ322DRAFT_997286 [Thelephora terrestris]